MNMAQDLMLSSVDGGAIIDTGDDDVPVVFHAADEQLSSFDDGAMIDTCDDDDVPVVFHAADDEQLSQQYCDDPLSDPLALDDCLNVDTDTMHMNLNSSSQEAEIILVDVDRLKNVSHRTVVSDSVAVHDSEHDPDEAYEQTDQLKPAETVEEGVPSDGSDSGIGFEQSANIESQPIRPVICKYYFVMF